MRTIKKLWPTGNRGGKKVAGAVIIGIITILAAHGFTERPATALPLDQNDITQIGDETDEPLPLADEPRRQVFLPMIEHPYQVYLPLIHVPPPFDTPFPENDAKKQSLNAYLTWSFRGNLDSGDYRFDIYLKNNDETPDQLIGTTQATFLEPPFTFELNTQYYWQVMVVDMHDGSTLPGPVWSFRTEDAPYPPPVGEMVSIPAHEFMMGCDINNPVEETCAYGVNHVEVPLHSVSLNPFRIDKYEVTNLQYRECVMAGVCSAPRRLNSKQHEHYYDNSNFDYYPVLYVSHWDAEDYCGWVGKRLPTEAEWELAARGAVDTRKWPWGDEPLDCTRATFKVDGQVCSEPWDMRPVGSHPRGASPFGLMDVSGNAFEWVSDLYDVLYYTYSPSDNPTGPDFSRDNIHLPPRNQFWYPIFTIRGGSNVDRIKYMRTAHRHWGHHGDAPSTDIPYFRSYRVGFRCAKSIEE